MQYQNRGPIVNINKKCDEIMIRMRYYPFPGLEDHPIHFQRWTVRVIKYFWGSIGFFARGEKNSIDPLSAGNRSVFEGGDPPKEGGSP